MDLNGVSVEAALNKPANTIGKMDQPQIDHNSRPLTVTFRTRQHAMEAWSAVRKILETFDVNPVTSAFMMETMTELAEAIDLDVKKELEEKGFYGNDTEQPAGN